MAFRQGADTNYQNTERKGALKALPTYFSVLLTLLTNKNKPLCPTESNRVSRAITVRGSVQRYTCNGQNAAAKNNHVFAQYTEEQFTLDWRKPIKSGHFLDSIQTAIQPESSKFDTIYEVYRIMIHLPNFVRTHSQQYKKTHYSLRVIHHSKNERPSHTYNTLTERNRNTK